MCKSCTDDSCVQTRCTGTHAGTGMPKTDHHCFVFSFFPLRSELSAPAPCRITPRLCASRSLSTQSYLSSIYKYNPQYSIRGQPFASICSSA